jgi:hypothetical protein
VADTSGCHPGSTPTRGSGAFVRETNVLCAVRRGGVGGPVVCCLALCCRGRVRACHLGRAERRRTQVRPVGARGGRGGWRPRPAVAAVGSCVARYLSAKPRARASWPSQRTAVDQRAPPPIWTTRSTNWAPRRGGTRPSCAGATNSNAMRPLVRGPSRAATCHVCGLGRLPGGAAGRYLFPGGAGGCTRPAPVAALAVPATARVAVGLSRRPSTGTQARWRCGGCTYGLRGPSSARLATFNSLRGACRSCQRGRGRSEADGPFARGRPSAGGWGRELAARRVAARGLLPAANAGE